jgi:hypothetical protein
MHRFLYFAGFAFIALCGAAVARKVSTERRAALPVEPTVVPPGPPAPSGSSGEQWFAQIKPFCNSVEVDVRTRYTPPPQTSEGAGYYAACYALAGKIDRAKAIIDNMRAGDRGAAANTLFSVAHPVADAGDDRASGPMMELVLEYWPENYMALYHAGMSEYSLGQNALAGDHLKAFLRLYNSPDGFTSAARAALAKIEEGTGSGKAVERETPARP